MLTQNIKTLAESFGRYATDGMVLEPAAVAVVLAVLDDMAQQADALEEIARQVARHHDIPEEILRIATLLHRDGVSRGMPKRNFPPTCPRCHALASFRAGFLKCNDTLHCGWIGSIDDAAMCVGGGQ